MQIKITRRRKNSMFPSSLLLLVGGESGGAVLLLVVLLLVAVVVGEAVATVAASEVVVLVVLQGRDKTSIQPFHASILLLYSLPMQRISGKLRKNSIEAHAWPLAPLYGLNWSCCCCCCCWA